MEISVKKIEQFEVIPSICKGEDKPPAFIFNTPSTSDLISLDNSVEGINQLMFKCFVAFKNKPVLKDENGKEVEFTNYKQFITCSTSSVIGEIHLECFNQMLDKINGIKDKATKTQKKSK